MHAVLWAESRALIDTLAVVVRERDDARKVLKRVYLEELNGRLCPMPELDDDRCCDDCRKTWLLIRAAVAEGHANLR